MSNFLQPTVTKATLEESILSLELYSPTQTFLLREIIDLEKSEEIRHSMQRKKYQPTDVFQFNFRKKDLTLSVQSQEKFEISLQDYSTEINFLGNFEGESAAVFLSDFLRRFKKESMVQYEPEDKYIYKPNSTETLLAFAKVGLFKEPSICYRLTLVNEEYLCYNKRFPVEKCLFRSIEQNKPCKKTRATIYEYHINTPIRQKEPFRFADLLLPWTFVFSYLWEAAAHAIGGVYLPQFETVVLCDTQTSEKMQEAMDCFEAYAKSVHPDKDLNVYRFPYDLFPVADLSTIDLQAVCNVRTKGLCQVYSTILPYLFAKEGLLTLKTKDTFFQAARELYVKYNKPSLETFQSILTELHLE